MATSFSPLVWFQKWQYLWKSPEVREFEAELRKLKVRYSYERQLDLLLPQLGEGTPITRLMEALITRTITERSEAFRLIPSTESIVFEIEGRDRLWREALFIPLKAHRSLVARFRYLANVDLLLRGAVLKGYSTLDYEGEEYGITLIFEPTDEGNETVTGHIRHLADRD